MSEITIQMPTRVNNYAQLVEAFERIRPIDFVYREDLPGYVREVLVEMGSTYENLDYVHVAGTNGKGSVSTKVAKGLGEAGYSVGVLTSPHLLSYRERIQWNGKCISERDMVKSANKVFSALTRKKYALGMVGVVACIALDFFATQKAKNPNEKIIAVIEAGIGGTGDHTNVIPSPLVSVVTSVREDHMNMLGDTLEAIAANKAGIIQRAPEGELSRAVVLGPRISPECKAVIQARADLEDCQVIIVPKKKNEDYELDNQATARCVLERICGREFQPSDDAIKAVPPARHHRIELVDFTKHRPVFDVAHNPAAFHALGNWLDIHSPRRDWTFALGIAKSKDLDACIAELAKMKRLKKVYLLPLSDPLLYSNDEMEAALKRHRITYERLDNEELGDGLQQIGAEASTQGWRPVFTGSFRTVAEITRALGVDLFQFPHLEPDSPGAESSPVSSASSGHRVVVRRVSPSALGELMDTEGFSDEEAGGPASPSQALILTQAQDSGGVETQEEEASAEQPKRAKKDIKGKGAA